jgi:NhaA family Na+:H+ antiporter
MSRSAPCSESTEHFCNVQAASGIALLSAAAAALLWANSPWSSTYARLWQVQLSIGSGHFVFSRPLHFWISDGLMAFFFLLVGLEIRREIDEGTLASPKAALLPIVAAIGGIIVPALLYVALNREPQMRHGWAIPTATDIAFATGALALLGRRVPPALRVLLLAIAVIDDIVAILLIAFVYSTGLDWIGLSIAAAAAVGLAVLLTLPVRFVVDRLLLGMLAWVGLLRAGAHPALAGVILGLLMPMDLVRRVEQRLHPWVAFGIMPLYAFANAGVRLEGLGASSNITVPLIGGVMAGLVIGKPLGITLSTTLCVKAGWCALPDGIDIKRVFVIGCIAGMGFTMSIFVCHLAFVDELLATAKLAVLIASAVAALVGLAAGRWLLPTPPTMRPLFQE